ncbi:UNVERIFIED_CONTAM: hypothetical protein K2H54_061182, partial [Gekko kuhli]
MEWTDPLALFFLVVLTTALLLKMGRFRNGNCQGFPPGPRPIPFIGNLHLLNLKRPYKNISELSKQYGPVFSLQLGSQKMVVLTGYETVKEALVNQAEDFAERPSLQVLEEIVKGHGILLAHGENWRVMRRFTLTTLRDYGMGKKTIEDRIVEECGFLIKRLESYEGEPFENTAVINAATANIIASILFGKRFEYEDPMLLRLLCLIHENARLLGSPSVLLHIMFPALGFLFGGSKMIAKNKDEIHGFIQAAFLERLQELDANDQRNFIDSFLIRQKEEKNKTDGFFHNENLKELVGNLFAAGTETTSTALRWGLLLMMKYPEIQHKVQEEIARVIGSAQPRTEHRAKMPYVDAVIHEVQRFAVAPSSLPLAATEDVTFKGYFIPK